jgi:hypothetical protein
MGISGEDKGEAMLVSELGKMINEKKSQEEAYYKDS